MFINAVFAGMALAAAFLASGSFRLPTLLRMYAASSLCLGLFIFGLGIVHGDAYFFLLAAISIALKTFIIPRVILRTARRTGMSMRLTSSLRPATTYLTVAALVIAVAYATASSPFAVDADPQYLLIAAMAMISIGFAMMIMRRDLLSQIAGFLIMENGIAAFSFATVRNLPFLVELGILMTLTAGVVLMGMISSSVRELYGTESTQALRELTD